MSHSLIVRPNGAPITTGRSVIESSPERNLQIIGGWSVAPLTRSEERLIHVASHNRCEIVVREHITIIEEW